MKTSRREFIGALAAAVAVSPIVSATAENTSKDNWFEDWFEDLVVDRYYTIQGGPYKDTGGWGCPYDTMGAELISEFSYWDHCRELEDKFERIEKEGFYLSQSQYLGKPYREYEKIPMTKKWLMEFYLRHKNDTPADWRRRYDAYYNALRASGYKDGYNCVNEVNSPKSVTGFDYEK